MFPKETQVAGRFGYDSLLMKASGPAPPISAEDRALGATLKLARIMQGMTPKEAAAQLGVTRSYVYNLEAGRKHPSLETLRVIANTYKIQYEDLVAGGEGGAAGAARARDPWEAMILHAVRRLSEKKRTSLARFLRDLTSDSN